MNAVRISLALAVLFAHSICADDTNIVARWNELFIRAVRAETTPPCIAARNLAMLHLSVHNAVSACPAAEKQFAAAAAAAHKVASNLYPSRVGSFDVELKHQLSSLGNDAAMTDAVAFGEAHAEAVLKARKDDGSTTHVPYLPSDAPGKWRRTGPAFRPPDLPQWGRVKPFAVTNLSAFRLPPPPALSSDEYADSLREAQRLGGKITAERTAEQEMIARFWSDFSYTETPPGHWNQIARTVANEKKLSIPETARLFALLNIALADAAIVAWDSKYFYDCWRPSTTIQKAGLDGNDETAGDPDWESLLQSPPFPEYPSGHSTFSGAAAAVLAEFFGCDSVCFSVTSDSMPGVTRRFTSFSAAADEIGRSRIYGGIHFAFSDERGQIAGRKVGRFVTENALTKR